MIWIGIDDTDTKDSRGTGHLARLIADHLGKQYSVNGVTRHQLLVDPRIPYTAKNSCAAIHLAETDINPENLSAQIIPLMRENYEEGSDPGLAVAEWISPEIQKFGQRAQREVITREEANSNAVEHGIVLKGLDGTEDGIIGALAAVGLAGQGSDGRYVMVGTVRNLSGLTGTAEILAAGVQSIQTLQGEIVHDGFVLAEKLRPARRDNQAILFVEKEDDYWMPLKLD